MKEKKSPDVDTIISKKWLVDYNRKPLDKYPLYGFILDVNDDFTLLHIFDRNLFILDGYCVLLNKDVKNHAVYDKEDYFLHEAIRAKRIVPKPPPNISIASWPEIVQSISENFPFLVVETERIHNDECYIGKVKEIKKKAFVLHEVDPDAYWTTIRTYKYDDVTMVKFGGRYENTLALVNSKREENPPNRF